MRILLTLIGIALFMGCGKTDREILKFQGDPGKDGVSCVASQTSSGVQISCSDGTVATISNGSNGQNGSSCSVQQTDFGATISCTDGSFAYIHNGENGSDGRDGESCSAASALGGTNITCGNTTVFVADGQDGTNGINGMDGLDGIDGIDGVDGLDGTSCSILEVSNGAQITCGNTSVVILDGKDGADGQDGTTNLPPQTIVSILDPCGDGPGFDDIVLQTVDGTTLMYLEANAVGNNQNGQKYRILSILDPGTTYYTNDAQQCEFTVDASGNIIEL